MPRCLSVCLSVCLSFLAWRIFGVILITYRKIDKFGLITLKLIRHSRLPAGNALWFCQNFFFFFFFFRHQGFRMITFDHQAGPLQNFNRSHIMVIGRSVLFSDPARPPGGGVGRPIQRPQTPQNPPPPPPKNKFLLACVSEPQEHF